MNQQARSIEATGATTDAAIQAGLDELGLTRDRVEVEIIREASRGVLGIGARDAVVRLTEILAKVERQPEIPPSEQEVIESEINLVAEAEVEAELEPVSLEAAAEPAPEPGPRPSSDQETLDLAKTVLTDLLKRMQIEAEVEARIVQARTTDDDPALVLNLQGKDLGFLIGRKGETLAAIQHLLRLIVNKTTQQRSNLIVDVEGYKIRRERALKKLALRIADQATRRNRRIALEPMSAYERRIIHMTLRNHPTVTTESVGEDERRKVTILPKQQAS